MIESSRTPVSASWRVRGIGVAVSVRTWTSARNFLRRSLWATPKCCSSSTTMRPRSRNLMFLPSSAWVPMTISTVPAVRPALTFASSAAPTRREACATSTGKPRKRSANVLKCWRASSVVGTTTATCLPDMRGDESRAQRHLGLAEADVAADQPVHRPARGKVVEHRVDGGTLVVGLVIGEIGAELVIKAVCDREPRRLAQMAFCRDLDEFARHLADAALQPRLARLPGDAAEPVEIDRGLRRSRSATAARCSRPAGTACHCRHSGFRGSREARRPPSIVRRPTKRPMP